MLKSPRLVTRTVINTDSPVNDGYIRVMPCVAEACASKELWLNEG